MKGACRKYRIKCDLTAFEIVGPITMVGPRGLRSVVAHRFAVPVLVLWAGLRKSRELNLDGEKKIRQVISRVVLEMLECKRR